MQKFNFFCWTIFLFLGEISAREAWVDPHDMNLNGKYQRRTNNDDCHGVYGNQQKIELRKFIAQLINSVRFDQFSDVYSGQINVQLTTYDFNFLQGFVSDDATDDFTIRRLNDILDSLIGDIGYFGTLMSFSERIYLAVWNEHTALVLVLLTVLYILWKKEPHNYELKTLFKIFLPLLYISDFVLRYIALLEEVEVDKYIEFKKFESCDESSLGWSAWFYNLFTGECKKDERAFRLSQRPAIHIITPMKVLAQQFDIVVPILKYFGVGCGKFMWALIDDMPWYAKIFVTPIAFILVILLMLMIGSYFFELSPKFNIFYLFQIEILNKAHLRNSHTENPQDSLSGENLTLFLKQSESRNSTQSSALPDQHAVPKIYIAYKTKAKSRINGKKKMKSSFEKSIKSNPSDSSKPNQLVPLDNEEEEKIEYCE